MLLAPFLWIFCEFDEKVLDNLSLECLANIFSPAGLLFTCKKRAKSCILYRLEEETHAACLKRFGARVFLSQKRNERSKDMDSVPDGKNTTKVKLHSLAFACFA